jgi:hypothetical protein
VGVGSGGKMYCDLNSLPNLRALRVLRAMSSSACCVRPEPAPQGEAPALGLRSFRTNQEEAPNVLNPPASGNLES